MARKPKFSESVGQAAREMEAEVKRVLDFIEARVVPRARRDGEKMLRRISKELNRWADRMHDEETKK
jgi:hypothetical protein